MKKLQIILDSFSARTKKQINNLGFNYIPLQSIINGNSFHEGINYSFEETINKIKYSKNAMTSQPNPNYVEDIFAQAITKAKKVIYLCVGSKISSTFSTASSIAKTKKFNNKIEVWDNSFVGVSFERAAIWLDKSVNEFGMSLQEAKLRLEKYSKRIITWIIPKNAEGIRKGGRVKKGTKILLSKMNIIPLIRYKNSQIDIKGVRRGFSKATTKVIERTIEEIGKKNIYNYDFFVIHTGQKSTINIMKNKLNDKGIFAKNEFTSTSIAIQVGVGALSLSAIPKKI